jgi:hypothetical protein
MGGIVSVRVLNEFASVARRKIRMPWEEVREALEAIRVLCATPRPHHGSNPRNRIADRGAATASMTGSSLPQP